MNGAPEYGRCGFGSEIAQREEEEQLYIVVEGDPDRKENAEFSRQVKIQGAQ